MNRLKKSSFSYMHGLSQIHLNTEIAYKIYIAEDVYVASYIKLLAIHFYEV